MLQVNSFLSGQGLHESDSATCSSEAHPKTIPFIAYGEVKYLCYPEHTDYAALGARVLEADFIGRKYL